MKGSVGVQFSEGVDPAFYIKAYATKRCSTLDDALEEMCRGRDRLLQLVEARERMAMGISSPVD